MSQNIYREEIMDHYTHPQNAFRPSVFTHSWREKNVHCGDEITVYLNVDKNILQSIHYEAKGCAISIASASILSGALRGKLLAEIELLNGTSVLKFLEIDLTPSRLSCAYLAVEAIKKALFFQKGV